MWFLARSWKIMHLISCQRTINWQCFSLEVIDLLGNLFFFRCVRRLWRQIWHTLLFLEYHMGWIYASILEARSIIPSYRRWCFISPMQMLFCRLKISFFLLTSQVQLYALPWLGTFCQLAFSATFSSRISWLFLTLKICKLASNPSHVDKIHHSTYLFTKRLTIWQLFMLIVSTINLGAYLSHNWFSDKLGQHS